MLRDSNSENAVSHTKNLEKQLKRFSEKCRVLNASIKKGRKTDPATSLLGVYPKKTKPQT